MLRLKMRAWIIVLWGRRWQLARLAACCWEVAFTAMAVVPAVAGAAFVGLGQLPRRLIDLAERRAGRPSDRPSVPPVDYPADLRNQAGHYLAVRN